MQMIFILSCIITAILVRLPYAKLPYMILSGGDIATLGLMTIDASMGKFHTFFYGQAYTGPIEVYIIAPLIRFFGAANYVFFAGSMIIYAGFLIITFLLVKEFKSTKSGFFALVYCILPPFYFYQHNIQLQGYHVTILILGNIIFLMTLKIKNNPGKYLYYLIFGLASGLGLWNHYAIFYYLIPSILFLVFRVRFKSLLKGGIAGILAFFLGSMPWWVYNIRYNFRSFNIYDGHPCVWRPIDASWLEILQIYFKYHICGILGINLNNIFGWVLLVIYIVSIINLVLGKNGLLFLFYICTLVFISVKNKYFIWGTKYDWRHALTVFSMVPLAVSALSEKLGRFNKVLGVVLMGIIIGINGLNLYKGFNEDKIKSFDRCKKYENLINFLEENKITGILGDFIPVQDINFLTKKKIVGAELFNGRTPTDEDVDAQDRIAFINCDDFASDINRLCYQWMEDFISEYNVLYGFIPYSYYGRVLDRKDWLANSNSNNSLSLYAIDGNLDNFWNTEEKMQAGAFFCIDFGSIHKIYKFSIVNIEPHIWNNPYGYKIEVSADGVVWNVIGSFNSQPQPLFWSGPRIYWDLLNGRWEVIFNPVDARFLRVTQNDCGTNLWIVNEIYVYEYRGQRDFRIKDYVKDARDIYEFLDRRGVQFVYADIYLSSKIRYWSGGRMGTLRRFNECWPGRENTKRLIKMDRNSAVVVLDENEKIIDDVLLKFDLNPEKKNIGGYICYLFNNVDDWEEYFLKKQNCLYWTGFGMAKINSRRAGILMAQFDKRKRHILRHKYTPSKKMNIEFVNGLRFKGYNLRVIGKKCQISYFWELLKDLDEYTVVFVYFIKDGKIMFQNDHVLAEQSGAVPNELFVERYWLNLPEPGRYEILIGMYLPNKKNKRVGIKGYGLNKSTKAEVGELEVK